LDALPIRNRIRGHIEILNLQAVTSPAAVAASPIRRHQIFGNGVSRYSSASGFHSYSLAGGLYLRNGEKRPDEKKLIDKVKRFV